MSQSPKCQFSIRVSPELFKELKEAVKTFDTSLSELTGDVLEYYLKALKALPAEQKSEPRWADVTHKPSEE